MKRLPDIQVMPLDFCQCMALKLGDIFDFMVYCTDGEYDWRGICHSQDLQKCIESGISAFIKAK